MKTAQTTKTKKAKKEQFSKADIKRLHNDIARLGIVEDVNAVTFVALVKAATKRMTWQSIAGVKAAITKDQVIF